jgi:maleate isomerase
MSDTLAPRAIIGVMTPAMNTVVQPELERLRPSGISNQMQRFRLGGERISDDLFGEAEKLMDANPLALAIGLTTDAGPGGVEKLKSVCDELQDRIGIPVCNASIATQKGLHALRAKRIAVLTPFNADIDQVVKANIEAGGFEVAAIKGTEAPSLPQICETPLDQIRDLARQLAATDCDAIAQIGTALPMVGLIEELERETGKTIVACNAAVYWQTLRALGINDSVPGFGRLLDEA